MEIIKIGNVEFTREEAESLYQSGRYLVTFSKIYQIFWSENAGVYGQVIFTAPKGENFVKRGRYMTFTASQVNLLLGKKVLNE